MVRIVTIAPGESTGWHYHPGRMDAVVLAGVLTRTLHDGRIEVNGAGTRVVEPAGPEYAHVGQNHGGRPVVLLATYHVPDGCPTVVAAPAPGWSR
ncbi:cupin domain-containing protein [Kitasatospora sp. NBC_00315]|uniref:cupin domain-containing protein n=1 Tax=Kitasatospora sp. NBC_00315 TaxID=2975963 RepID=UPI0032465B40